MTDGVSRQKSSLRLTVKSLLKDATPIAVMCWLHIIPQITHREAKLKLAWTTYSNHWNSNFLKHKLEAAVIKHVWVHGFISTPPYTCEEDRHTSRAEKYSRKSFPMTSSFSPSGGNEESEVMPVFIILKVYTNNTAKKCLMLTTGLSICKVVWRGLCIYSAMCPLMWL